MPGSALRPFATRSRAVAPDAAVKRKAPAPPTRLGRYGKAAWRKVMTAAPLLLPDLDAITVSRFCDIIDERELVRTELKRGVLLSEPIVSPTGKVVGERLVPNPAHSMLRALDKQLDALGGALGLVPAARARLGLTLSTAERQALEVTTLLDARFKEDQ